MIARAVIGFFFFICCSIFSITLASFSFSSIILIIEEANSVHAFSDCLDFEQLPICTHVWWSKSQTLHPVRLLVAFSLSIIRNPNPSYGVLGNSFFRKKKGMVSYVAHVMMWMPHIVALICIGRIILALSEIQDICMEYSTILFSERKDG